MYVDLDSLVVGVGFGGDGLWEYCVGEGFGVFELVVVVEYLVL